MINSDQAEQIIMLNALGPYDHGVWRNKEESTASTEYGSKSLFVKRAPWLVNTIATWFKQNFSKSELSQLTVVEFGSYDGWVLTYLSKEIGFKEAVGVEPRTKNIKKGEAGRSFAGIATECVFMQGEISDAKDLFQSKKFDFVICLGVLHHVTSTFDSISTLSELALRGLVLDSMVIPEPEAGKNEIEPYVNTKDVVYQGHPPLWGLAAFKYESPYSDGSGAHNQIVNVPSETLIRMSIKSNGFDEPTVIGTETDFFSAEGQALRGVRERLMVAKRATCNTQKTDWKSAVSKIEETFACHILPHEVIKALENYLRGGASADPGSTGRSDKNVDNLVLDIVENGPSPDLIVTLEKILNHKFTEQDHMICASIFRSPREKTLFEVAKHHFYSKDFAKAEALFFEIISISNCDWWSFYRSVFFLNIIEKQNCDLSQASKYKELLVLSNEFYPYDYIIGKIFDILEHC